MSSSAEWRAVRDEAASRFKPKRVKLLLIAEAPPSSLDRYFYFPTVRTQDSLFRYVARLTLGTEPTRKNKVELLSSLQRAGVYLMDVSPEPIRDDTELRPLVPEAVRRAATLRPEHIIIIKAGVFDLMYWPLKEAGMPLVEHRVPFPGSGQQRRFEEAMEQALASINWVRPS
jgi:hypothetical protein